MATRNAGTLNKGADAGALAASSADESTSDLDPGNDGIDAEIYAELGESLEPSEQDTEIDEVDDLADEVDDDADLIDDDDSEETDEGDAENADDESDEGDDESDEEDDEAEDDESEEDESDEEDEDPDLSKVPAGLRKRFRELTGGLKERDTKIATLTTELQQAQQVLEKRTAEPEPEVGQVVQINDPQKLADYRKRIIAARAWALRHPNGGEAPDGKGGTREVGPDEVGETLAYTEQVLMDEIPQRDRFLQEREHMNRVAVERYPDLADPASRLSKQVAASEQHYAAFVQRFPEARMLILDALAMQLQRAGEQPAKKPAAKPAARKQAAPVLRTGGKRSALRRDPKLKRRKARERLEQSDGTEADLTASLMADL